MKKQTANTGHYKVPCCDSKANELCGVLRADTGQKKFLRGKTLVVRMHVGSLQMRGEIQYTGGRGRPYLGLDGSL